MNAIKSLSNQECLSFLKTAGYRGCSFIKFTPWEKREAISTSFHRLLSLTFIEYPNAFIKNIIFESGGDLDPLKPRCLLIWQKIFLVPTPNYIPREKLQEIFGDMVGTTLVQNYYTTYDLPHIRVTSKNWDRLMTIFEKAVTTN